MAEQTLNGILEALGDVVAADLAVILAWEDRETLRVRAARGPLVVPALEGLRVSLVERPQLAAAVRGEATCVIHEDEQHEVHEPDTYADVLKLPETHTCVAAPLRAGDASIGVLTLDSLACHAFSRDQLRAVDGFARLAARVLYEEQRADRLSHQLDALAAGLNPEGPAGARLIGVAGVWRATVERARLVAPTPATVLITGPTGTGKEQLARAIHQWSPRAGGPFVALNCSALVPELALSELFGHEQGAFTGADRRRAGRFELAAGGTLFLDEVADLPANAQAQLLRVLQERTFERVGGAGEVLKADVRLIAATHKALGDEVEVGQFRADLFYRLNAFPLAAPPLSARRGDIARLALHFVEELRSALNMPGLAVTGPALRLLEAREWPGNVRELRNALERAAILAGGGRILPRHLDVGDVAPDEPLDGELADAWAVAREASRGERWWGVGLPGGGLPGGLVPADGRPRRPLPEGLTRFEQAQARAIVEALADAGGKVGGPGGAAALLGLKATTLHSTMKRLRLK